MAIKVIKNRRANGVNVVTIEVGTSFSLTGDDVSLTLDTKDEQIALQDLTVEYSGVHYIDSTKSIRILATENRVKLAICRDGSTILTRTFIRNYRGLTRYGYATREARHTPADTLVTLADMANSMYQNPTQPAVNPWIHKCDPSVRVNFKPNPQTAREVVENYLTNVSIVDGAGVCYKSTETTIDEDGDDMVVTIHLRKS